MSPYLGALVCRFLGRCSLRPWRPDPPAFEKTTCRRCGLAHWRTQTP